MGSRRQQHPGLLHPGRDQFPRSDPCRQAGAGPRLPAGADRARQLLGLHLADARKHAHDHVDHVGPDHPALAAGSWKASGSIPSASSTPRGSRLSSSSTGSRSWACSRWSGTRRSSSTAPIPDFHRRDLWDAIQTRRLSRNGSSGLQLFDEDVRRRLRLRRARRDQDHPGGGCCRCAASAGWCWTGWSTISSPRPSRWLSAPRTSCRASTSPTTRCCRAAISPTSTRSSSGWAARTSPRSRSTRRAAARSMNFQQDGHMRDAVVPKGRANYQPNSWGEGPREFAGAGLPQLSRAEEAGAKRRLRPESFADHYSQARQFFISQTEVEQTASHRRPGVRAQQGRDAGDPRADGLASARTSTRRSAATWPPGLRLKDLPNPADAARPTRSDLPAVAGAEHPPERPAIVRRPQDRGPGYRRRRRGLLAALQAGARPARAPCSRSWRPMVGGVEVSDGTWLEADEKLDGGPSVLFDAVALLPSGAGRGVAGPGSRRRATSSPTRSPIASSSAMPPPPSRC